jgi:predicted nucleotidyltransferase
MLTIDEIKKVVTLLARKYGAERVYLFGSFARGEATEKSDIDLRIDTGSIRDLFEFAGLVVELEEALKTHVDLLSTRSLDNNFLKYISEDEIIIYENK